MRFATRQDTTKQALLNPKLSRGTANVYVCPSKTKYSFEAVCFGRIVPWQATISSALLMESTTAVQVLKQRLQTLTGALIITAVLLHYGIPDSIAHAPTTCTPSTL
ncbi:hypothetical protein JG687_00018319 [Phytophthora cactorum]|uniref:Uncharacterized protein n=1 Tax=Phytophthora cactorum TaxID=29920 RepID=A0A8T1TP72_9STRA|nr:hypothetical protein JG687_00018319 [Phytophthora cactorum]